MNRLLLLTFSMAFIITGCVQKFAKPVITRIRNTPNSPFSISNVQLTNNQFVISGTNLNLVTNFKFNDGSTTRNLAIESQSANSLIANTLGNINLAAGSLFNFILSNANASSAFQVTFTPGISSITAPMLTSMGATQGQVMKYNGSVWIASSISNTQTYIGTWNANSNIPDLTVPSATPGDYYIASVAGTLNSVNYAVGDWIISDGYNWDHIANSAVAVSSFKGIYLEWKN